jgi:hypothetical protein
LRCTAGLTWARSWSRPPRSPAGTRPAGTGRGRRPWSQGDSPFFVSVRGEDADEIAGYWKKLTDGSTVVVDLAPAAWAPLYGMLTDPFGITWVLDVAVEYNPLLAKAGNGA